MDDFIFWMILIALAIIIGNQLRERQERETKGMTKKQKAKYFQDIKNKQKQNLKAVWIILGIMLLLMVIHLIIIFTYG